MRDEVVAWQQSARLVGGDTRAAGQAVDQHGGGGQTDEGAGGDETLGHGHVPRFAAGRMQTAYLATQQSATDAPGVSGAQAARRARRPRFQPSANVAQTTKVRYTAR